MSQSEKSKDNTTQGMTRRDFLQTAGMATLAMGSGALSLTSVCLSVGTAMTLLAVPALYAVFYRVKVPSGAAA